jgi:hypothetical protein
MQSSKQISLESAIRRFLLEDQEVNASMDYAVRSETQNGSKKLETETTIGKHQRNASRFRQ